MSKPDPTRFPPSAFLEICHVLEHGDEKHGEASRYKDGSRRHVAAAMRHAFRLLEGVDIDPDSRRKTLAHIGARIAIALEIELREPHAGRWRENSADGSDQNPAFAKDPGLTVEVSYA